MNKPFSVNANIIIAMGSHDDLAQALALLGEGIQQIRFSETKGLESQLKSLKTEFETIERSEIAAVDDNLVLLEEESLSILGKESNTMRIFAIEGNELSHSNFLAWLLDPKGDHGLGTIFIERFLKEATAGQQALDVDFSKLSVCRETSRDKSRLDIEIRDLSSDYFLCAIENKIFSEEGLDQTDREYSDCHGACDREVFVFLKLDEKAKPKNSNFIPINYRQILPLLEGLDGFATNARAKLLIADYINTLKCLVMSSKFEGFSERTKLYYKYQKYIHDAKAAFESDRALLLESIKDGIMNSEWWDDDKFKMDKTGGQVSIWKRTWEVSPKEYIKLIIEPSTETASIYIYYYGLSEFMAKYHEHLIKALDLDHNPQLKRQFKMLPRNSIFIEKDLQLAISEKDQVDSIIKAIDEMREKFEKIIDESIHNYSKNK